MNFCHLNTFAYRAKTFLSNSVLFYSSYCNRNLNCGDVNLDYCDQKVVLHGWLHNSRFNGNIILLRDSTGIVQLIPNNYLISKNIPSLESVIKVEGLVKKRSENQINNKMKSGHVEVLIDKLEVLNEADKDLPFFIKDHHKTSELHRLKYRYIDLRREDIQNVLRLRSSLEFSFCEFLIKMNNFVNIGTPSLFKSSPGGAREFIVPTKDPGMCYSLIQSPQQHKQLLMVGGVDRYMQFARCYRNEMSRPDRQPEFTQLDIEMSFIEKHHLKSLIEDMLDYSLKHMIPDLITPFPVISYNDAINLYGSDKPDIRFDMKIENFSRFGTAFIGIRIKSDEFKYIDLNKMHEVLQENYPDKKIEIVNCFTTSIYSVDSKYELKENYALILKNTNNIDDYHAIGKVRNIIASQLNSKGKSVYNQKFAFAWVDRFPLFEMNNGVLQSVHHQFTSPIKEHIDLLYTCPEKVVGEQLDLIGNGVEIGGGSIRIHKADMQEHVIKNILKEDISMFSHLIRALRSGAPPHGGFALGNDRLISVLTGCNSIRDVIAFPKTADGKDIMSGAPSELSVDQCEYYNINFTNKSAEVKS